MPKLSDAVSFLDTYLDTAQVQDYPGAWNGLQVENSGHFARIGAAVDACTWTIERAVEQGISLLLVHHGLFWNGVQPLTGPVRRKMKAALDGDLAIYSSHLPLDLHPEVGNNALLCRALGLEKCTPFFIWKGQATGLQTQVELALPELAQRIERAVGSPPQLCAGGPARTARIGVVTGGAGGEIARAAAEGVDTFITGEGPHHSFLAAEELGMNVFYAGHYATEVFGVKALAHLISEKFGMPWEFIDHPIGL